MVNWEKIASKTSEVGKSPLGSVVKYYIIRACYGIIGADKLAHGAPVALLGFYNDYPVLGHHNSPTFACTYTQATTIALFRVKLWHFRQFTLSISTLASMSAICL